jgi:hypothetical protein
MDKPAEKNKAISEDRYNITHSIYKLHELISNVYTKLV